MLQHLLLIPLLALCLHLLPLSSAIASLYTTRLSQCLLHQKARAHRLEINHDVYRAELMIPGVIGVTTVCVASIIRCSEGISSRASLVLHRPPTLPVKDKDEEEQVHVVMKAIVAIIKSDQAPVGNRTLLPGKHSRRVTTTG